MCEALGGYYADGNAGCQRWCYVCEEIMAEDTLLMWVWVHVCTCIWKLEVDAKYHSTLVFETGSQRAWSPLIWVKRLSSKLQRSSCLYSPVLGLWMVTTMPSFSQCLQIWAPTVYGVNHLPSSKYSWFQMSPFLGLRTSSSHCGGKSFFRGIRHLSYLLAKTSHFVNGFLQPPQEAEPWLI